MTAPLAQKALLDFLGRPESYGLDSNEQVVRIDTHISAVFLAGDRAYKLKKAVKLPFLDFSSLASREKFCQAELAVNRRTAPDLYLEVAPVYLGAAGDFSLGRPGEIVDWLVVMRRFDQEERLDRLFARGALDRHAVTDLAEVVAEFHVKADVMPAFGGRAGLAHVIATNDATFALTALPRERTLLLKARSEAWLEKATPMLEARRSGGFVRHVHGDLHLGNVFRHEGKPVLFDAIDFNEEFASVDTLFDLAFLLMDLDHGGHRGLASALFNHYLPFAGEWAGGKTGGLLALPLFLSLRAAIRSHVEATRAAQCDEPNEAALRLSESKRYLEEALDYLDPPPPRLIAVGGLSGCGKSRLARELAPFLGAAPGALVLRSDVIRKRLMGKSMFERLAPEAYGAEMTIRTFEALFAEARAALEAGHSVIADAVFARPEQRERLPALAASCGVPFDAAWVEAPPAVLMERVRTRSRNASDATPQVLEMQHGYELGGLDWPRIDSSGTKEDTLALAQKVLRI
ncbi:MAG: AAA family ATPase [Alphaproteobacteria bacterium]|nr:AAA family ATPase [Alphaproteobacteria bacterium]